MTKALIIQLPFSGFYESLWSSALDTQEEQFIEYACGEGDESQFPPELRLDSDVYADALMNATDHRKSELAIVRGYVDAFDSVAKTELGFSLGLTFETMDSPREYNFKTDRVFAFISPYKVRRLFAMSRRDKHATLATEIKEHCTSYDGFISWYSNTLDAWLAKPVIEWDHNELKILLYACLAINRVDVQKLEYSIYEEWPDSLNSEWEAGVDFAKFDAAIADKRNDLRIRLGLEFNPRPLSTNARFGHITCQPRRNNRCQNTDTRAFPRPVSRSRNKSAH